MVKVLIVEDEYLARVGLMSIVEWENEGFNIVGDASDGMMAYEMYLEFKPDIIITDIGMPKMNGLDLIQKIRLQDTQVKFLIVSCHSDFAYAKKAIEYGVTAYLEKSEMEPEQLLSTLHKLKNEIDYEKSPDDQHKKSEEIYLEVLENTTKKVNELIAILEKAQIKFKYTQYALILFKVDLLKTPIYNPLLFHNVAKEMMTEKYSGFIVEVKPGISIILASYDPNYSDGLNMTKDYIHRVTRALKNVGNLSMQCITAQSINSLDLVPSIYRQLMKLERYLVFYNNGEIISQEELNLAIDENFVVDYDYERLYFGVLNGEDEGILEIIRTTFEEMRLQKLSLIKLYGHCNQLIATLNKVLGYYYGYFSQIYQQIYIEYDVLRQMYSLEDIIEYFLKKYSEVAMHCRKFSFYQGNNQMVHQVIQFLINHHNEVVTLEDVAFEQQISRVYLSQLIKKETGDNFVNILNRIRIEKAKLLIQYDQYKVYEIADSVGFGGQSSYFIKVFKMIEGMTPSEYKRKYNNIKK